MKRPLLSAVALVWALPHVAAVRQKSRQPLQEAPSDQLGIALQPVTLPLEDGALAADEDDPWASAAEQPAHPPAILAAVDNILQADADIVDTPETSTTQAQELPLQQAPALQPPTQLAEAPPLPEQPKSVPAAAPPPSPALEQAAAPDLTAGEDPPALADQEGLGAGVESDPETDATLMYIRNKLAGAARKTGALRKRLGRAALIGRRLRKQLQAEHAANEAALSQRRSLERRLEAERRTAAAAATEEGQLKQELSRQQAAARAAQEEQSQLEAQLAEARASQERERAELRERLAQDQQSLAAERAAAREREGSLSQRLANASGVLAQDAQALAQVRERANHTAHEAERLEVENAQLRQELREAAAERRRLSGQLSAANATLRQAQQNWTAEQAKMLQQEADQKRALDSRESQADREEAQLRQELHQLRAEQRKDAAARAEEAKSAEARAEVLEKQVLQAKDQGKQQQSALRRELAEKDAALQASQRQLNASVALAQRESGAAQAQASRLEDLVAAEKVEEMRRTEQLQDLRKKLNRKQNLSKRLEKLLTESQRISHAKVANLTKRLATADRLVSTLQQERTMLSKAIVGNASQAARLRERADVLGGALRASRGKVAALLAQRSALEKDLVGNRTVASHLSESVRVLKKKVKDGTEALEEAKRAAEHAEAEKEGAEAVAKQLQGTVPQLLANAQAANERVETERVLRQRETLLAARAREALKARMTSDVQRQLEKLSVVVPKLDAASSDSQQGQALATDLSDDVSDVLEQAAGEQDKSPAKQAPAAKVASGANNRSLAQDGRGLARLLGSALGSDDGAQSQS